MTAVGAAGGQRWGARKEGGLVTTRGKEEGMVTRARGLGKGGMVAAEEEVLARRGRKQRR